MAAMNVAFVGQPAAVWRNAVNVMKDVVDRISEELLLRANHTSDSVPARSDLIQELLDQNKELIRCLTENKHQVNHSPRRNIPKPKQGQKATPLPPRYNKYCCTHGRCNHNGPTSSVGWAGIRATSLLIH